MLIGSVANLERLRAHGGVGQRADYEKTLKIISTGGLAGLRDRVRKYGPTGLAGLVLGTTLPGLLDEPAQDPGG